MTALRSKTASPAKLQEPGRLPAARERSRESRGREPIRGREARTDRSRLMWKANTACPRLPRQRPQSQNHSSCLTQIERREVLIAAGRLRKRGAGSVSGTMKQAPEPLAQLEAAAEQSCAHGLRRQSQLLGSFLSGKIADVPQQTNAPQRRIQLAHRFKQTAAQFLA